MKKEDIEDVYRLSPVQAGMLFHAVHAADRTMYFQQFNGRFDIRFDPEAFTGAWQTLVDASPTLRTCFLWQDLEEPVQIVARRAAVPVDRLDWSALPPRDQEERLSVYVEEDRHRGFDLARPPLLRLALIDLGRDVWQLVWSYHHLILDGWSVGLLHQEVQHLALRLLAGEPAVARPRRPFKEYVAWLRRQDLGEAEDYWRRALAGFTAPTPLGIDRPRARAGRAYVEEEGYATRVRLLPRQDTAALKAFAQRHRLTLSTVVEGAWALLLSRYSRDDDLVFGTTVSGRPPSLPGVEAMLGCFINTLPVRVRVPAGGPERADGDVVPWLHGLQLDQAKQRRFEHSPLVQVIGWSEVPRQLPLFESIFVFENFNLELEQTFSGVFQRTNYPLTLVFAPGEEMAMRADYELARFETAAIDRLLGHLATLLGAMAGGETRLSELSPLTPEERAALLAGPPQSPDPAALVPLHRLFEERAWRAPDAVAVVCEEEGITYGELDRRAGALAHRLCAVGVGPEVLVGLCAERSALLVVAILGILKAGGAYLPLDPRYPDSRLALIVEDSGVDVLVATGDLRARVPGPRRVVLLDGSPALGGASGEAFPAAGAPEVSPQNLAYVIYTSGSTGRPKGSLITHANAARLFAATAGWFGFGEGDVWTLFHSFAFDFSVWELWGALAHGGRLVVVPWWVSRSPAAFYELLVREGVTVLNQTPSAFRQLAAAEGERGGPAPGLALDWVVFGGEALDPASLTPWYERRPGPRGDRRPRLVNMYGITETTVHVSFRPLSRGDLAEPARSPIGKPIPDLGILVLDPCGHLAPVGVAGEMLVGGAGLARGYLGRPDLTAERFVPDPWSGAPGARLYCTGDLARRMEDGGLEYLGRIDHQVKVRGFRIEPAEIEAALAAHPAVAAAVVLAVGEGEDRRLAACVVPRAGAGSLDAPALRAHLLERLPEHMVPAAWVELEALPLTAHGKVDRRALAARAAAEQVGTAPAFVAPRTPVEELLAGLFGEVLGVERVGAHDGFFDLGGHSLLATRLLARVREAFGVDLPVQALFETPAVAELTPRIEEAWAAGGRLAAPPLVAASGGSEEAAAPLSFAQERLWFLDQLQPGLPAYNIPAAVRLTGALDAAALAAALAELRRRHASLRTVFAAPDGRPVQVVLPAVAEPLPLADLSGIARQAGPAAGRSELARLAREEASRPFDLAAGPLLRTFLVRLGEEEHALLLTQHHIVSDGWSLGIFLDELTVLYTAFRAGRPSPLPSPALQYADFARWQRSWLHGEVLESQIACARERLAGVPVLQLPHDHPRREVQTFAGGARPFVLPAGLAASLQPLARRERATLFMLVLAAYQALLHRLSGQGDLAVGSPVAGRSRPEVEPLIGFFVNTLVLRSRPAGDPAFRALLAAARAEVLAAYANQDVPLERLVQELVAERDLGHAPLFQAMLAFGVPEPEAMEIPGLALTPLATGLVTSKFDLSLSVARAETLAGQWVWSAALFDPATVARWAGHFETLLAGLAADPACRLSALPLLSAAERGQLLVEWNLPRVDYPEEGYLHEMIAAQAARRPDSVALSFEGAVLSYGELMRRVEALVRRLRRLGAGPEVVVGVCGDRSPELVTALLGVLAAGAAYLPLDPALPAERLAFMLEDARVPLLLADERLPDAPPEGPWLAVPFGGGRSSDPPAAEPEARAGDLLLDHPAYVIYTSGSTGRPKGVVVSHRSLGNRTQYARAVDMDESTVFLQKTTISFDVSVLEIFGPLAAGGRTVLAHPEGVQDPAYLVRTILEQGVTDASFTSTLLALQCEQEGFARCRCLRTVITGGETVPVALPRRFYELLDADLLNRYGPTEATVSVTSWVCGREESPRVLPIGRPTARARAYLLDAALEPVAVGVVGELYLGGVCVARGYLGRPDLTAEHFVPSPFGEGDGMLGARLYRSGDLARWRPDGVLEFAGRVDQQVKVRGFRIELGEIEAALSLHPAVSEVAVVDREEGASRSLAAYLVAAPGQILDEAALREFLGARLPAYMVPADFVELAALPLTLTGKVDRRALPAPRRSTGEGSEPPRGPVEEVIAAIWCELLGRERVGRGDSFFELGGHSLLATQAVSRMRRALGVELPLRRLFESPTLAALAAEVQAARSAAHESRARSAAPESMAQSTAPGIAAPPIEARSPADAIELPDEPGIPARVGWPLSFAQERLWFLDQLEPGGAVYHIPIALRLRGDLAAAALARGLGEIVRRHESLRTVFPAVAGRPVQVVLPEAAFRLPLADLSALPAPRREDEARRLAAVEATRPFDLAGGGVLRGLLARLGEREHAVVLVMHHIASDGWSMGVLVHELGRLYGAFSQGRPSPLPALPVQYADYAVWQRRRLAGEVLEAETAFWREALAGVATLDLPADRPRPAVRSHLGAHRPLRLPAALGRGFAALARARGATPFMALLAAFQVLLGRSARQTDVTVGTPIAGRNRGEVEGLIGFFVNTLVLRADLSGEPGFLDLLDRVRARTLAAYAHQDLPFERLVAELQPERHLGRTPLFQVLFVLLGDEAEAPSLPGLELAPIPAETGTAKFDLTLSVGVLPDGGLAGRAEYDRDLFDAATIDRLLAHYGNLLAAVVAGPHECLSDLPLLSAAERHQLVAEWNEARVGPACAEECLHRLFAAQAARRPEAPAVVAMGASLEAQEGDGAAREEGERWSYGELDRRANRIAHLLLASGGRPGERVGVCLERSAGLVAALLGTLKAGCAYVPLDPSYPAERLALILADSGVRLVLTEERLAGALPVAEDWLAAKLPVSGGRPAAASSVEDEHASGHEGRAGAGPGPVVLCLDRDAELLARQPDCDPGVAADPGMPAYVIYTSGSTGRPKGVVVTHGNVSRLLSATAPWFGFGPEDVWTLFHSYAFDFSVWELWGALAYGGRLVVVPYWVSRSPEAFYGLLRDEGVTVLNQTPSAFRQLVWAEGEALGRGSPELDLRLVIFGGEALDPTSLAPWYAHRPEPDGDRRPLLVNMYGITETTVHVTYRPLSRADASSSRSLVGRVIPDLSLHVLDPAGGWEPAPVGVPGEICVGGAGLALGYLGQPELMAEKFVPDPFCGATDAYPVDFGTATAAALLPDLFSAPVDRGSGLNGSPGAQELDQGGAPGARQPDSGVALGARQFGPGGALGARLYRSGDLARRLPDGDLEYLGRLDTQVKVRGFRIELGEIEAALVAHPAVREAAVLLREDGPGGDSGAPGDQRERRLVAYAVPEPGAEPTAAELRAHLAGRLPDYMLPAATVLLPALPLTANGKLDRRALPAPERDMAAAGAYVPPRTEVERLLAGIWAGLLRVERVGAEDNFFALGGDSILAIQVISRLARAGHRLSARQVFERPTLAGLAALVVPVAGVSEEGPASGPVSLTPIQRWFLDRRPADPHHFNQAVLLEAAEPLAPACLERALAVLAGHHYALRLRFEDSADGGWRQRYEEEPAAGEAFPLAHLDLAALPAGRRREALEEVAASAQESLDLAAGPLARAVLFFNGAGEADRLLLVVHHLAVDGVSWRILLEDLESAHRQVARGNPAALPPRTSSFGGWAARLVERAAAPAAEEEARFWLGQAESLAPLPVDLDAGANDVASARGLAVALSEEETLALLQEAPRAYRTGANDLLLTALARAFAHWTGARRLRLDLEGHGREEVFPDLDLSRTVGWFTALFPVTLDLGNGVEGGEEPAGPGEEIKRVKEQLRAVPGRGLAYGLVRHLGTGPTAEVAAGLRSLPDPAVVFNYLGQLDAAVAPGRLFRPAAERSGPARSPRQLRPHLLEVTASVAGGRFQVVFTYSARSHLRSTVEALAGSFLNELRTLVAHCLSPEAGGLTPSDVPLARLTGPELDRLVAAAMQAATEGVAAAKAAAGGVAAGRAAVVEDLYPLSPVQAGMLFHGLHLPESGAYVEQLSITVGAGFDAAAFERGWRRLFARHPVLRTAFAWRDLERPLQVVYREVDLPWESRDWRRLPADEAAARWSALLAEDRRRGFDLGRPPLSRFHLARVGEERWRFLWTHHHALLDGWSMPILLGELFALYREEGGGPAATLGAVRPYRDYIAWLEGRDLGESERFFRAALAGFDEPTPLAIDAGVPTAGEAARQSRTALLPASQSEALRGFARRHRLTVNTLVQGAWALLLARYSGRRDVVFGAVTSGRSAPVPEIEQIVGLFINTLPARAEVDPRDDLLPWLAELQERQVEIRGHEHTPLAEVGAWSEVPRGTPLFESILAFENYPVERSVREEAGGGLLGAEMVEQTNYPLSLAVAPGPRLLLRVGHDARRIDGASAERLLGHLAALLAGILAGAGRKLGDLPLLGEAERHQLEVEWNDGAAFRPPGDSGSELVHRLIEARVRASPAATAVVAAGREIAYGDLHAAAGRLARYLAALGVGPDQPVGVSAERSPELVVGILAVLMAGGAYVPLDPALPPERLALMSADAGLAWVLASGAAAELLAALLGETGAGIVRLDRPESWPESWVEQGSLDAAAGMSPESAAYVLYTSGSTGRPKGVVVSHRSVANRLRFQAAVDMPRPGRMLQRTTASFDVSVLEILGPLAAGSAVVLAPAGGLNEPVDPDELIALIARERVTHVNLPPSLLAVLLDRDGLEGCRDLARVAVGAETLPPELPARFAARFSDRVTLLNRYGPTEVTIAATSWPCELELEPEAAPGRPLPSIPIGRPIAGARIYVLGSDLAPVPAGVPGEIWIGGPGVARGYLGRPDLTAASFLPDPFAHDEGGGRGGRADLVGGAGRRADLTGGLGGRLYRTGDLGRRRADGALEFLGRIDAQVKIRGFRVEPGEVEAALSAHPEVAQAAVVDRLDAAGVRLLLAYFVARPGSAPAEAELKSWLGARLPAYMVPSVVHPLAELPLTPSGKVDRRALARREPGGPAGASIPPRGPVARRVAGIWREILGARRVGMGDSFFELGGHSLSAMKLASRLRSTFGVEVPLRRLLEAPTLAEQAAEVEAAQAAGRETAAPPLRPRAGAGVAGAAADLPLSYAQERLWFLDRMQPGAPIYNMPLAVRMEGRLDEAAFRAALREVARRHESLRTTFAVHGVGPVQVVAPALDLPVPAVDLSGLPEELREPLAGRLAGEEARRPFDLAAGPLIRATLLCLGPAAQANRPLACLPARFDPGLQEQGSNSTGEEASEQALQAALEMPETPAGRWVALLTLHHIAGDGWSMGVLMREVGVLYAAFAKGRRSPLSELPVQYADFAVWQRGWLTGEVLARQLAWWREVLAGAPTLDLPTDRPRPAVQRFSGAKETFLVPAAACRPLLDLGRRRGATPYVTLLAAFAVLLHRTTGQDDLVLGTTAAGRDRRELEPLIGFFVNSLALRADLGGRPGFAEVLARLRETALSALAHADLPFEKLVAELQPVRDLSRAPVFQVVFQLHEPPAEVELPGLRLRPVAAGSRTAKFDFVLNVNEVPQGLAVAWSYNTDLFDRATLARWSRRLERIIAAAGADPARPVADLPLLSAAERHQLLAEWNDGPADPAHPEECLHRLFAAQVARRPEAPAVVAAGAMGEEGERWSYGELDRRANRIAHLLLRSEARPGERVGVCLERSAGLVAALLGTLKAGCAYVPLDPAYPAERLAFILADSGVRLVITEERLAGSLEVAEEGPAATLAAEGERPAAAPAAEDGHASGHEGGVGAGPGPIVLCLDRNAELLARQPDCDPGVAADPGLPAYVIYTSGSTGLPKGVVITHGNVSRLLSSTEPWFGFGPEDVWTLFHSYAFDFSVWELWGALGYGGRLVVVPYWVSRSPEAFYGLLRDEGVTVLNQTPSAFRQLVRAEGEALGGDGPELDLRLVIFGGEALDPTSLAPWYARRPEPDGDRRPLLVNMYGITETTVHVTYRPLTRDDASSPRSLVGVAIQDLSLHVLDPAGGWEPAPVGVPGEICVGGAGLALGYLGQPELTAPRFVPDPFGGGGAPGARLYRSGDLARRLPDGDLEYLGRLDAQVKVRGFRIELGEIEAALVAHPAVREAAVLLREDGPGGDSGAPRSPGAAGDYREPRLVAYAVPEPGAEPTAAELRAHLAGRLPDYMLPAATVLLPSLPLTPNGKLDRRALPAPEAAAAPGRVAPRNEVERFVAGLWRDALGLPDVGVHDNFFALGGSSITAAVLVSRLQERLGEIVHVVVIFDAQTVAELAEYLVDQHPAAVARLFGRGALGGRDAGGRPEAGRVGPAEIERFRGLLARAPVPPVATEPSSPALPVVVEPNPPALFVLSPPRSGSTLLRVMLAGHPLLFAPPELELLSFATLCERRAAFSGRDSFWLEGVIRAVMEARGCGAAEAEALVAACEREGLSTLAFYGRLQEWIGASRLLVDKTPSYALDPGALDRAEEGFREPLYVHLVRHPQGMIRSFEEAKLDQLFFRREHLFSRRQLAELIWLESHRRVAAFLRGVPRHRQCRVRFEDLLAEPERELQRICALAGLDYHPAMATPYERSSARMVDGPHAESRMLGDVKFRQHGRVDRAVAERWRDEEVGPLAGETADLAAELGYDRPAAPVPEGPPRRAAGSRPPSRRSPSPLLVPIQPRGERPPFFCLHPGGGGVLCYAELARELGEEQPFYGIQALGLKPGEEVLSRVEEVAERALAGIAALDPAGPYLLGGWSFGGAVAYEMACRLAASGRQVGLLALIDTVATVPADAAPPDECEVLARAFEVLPLSAADLRALAPEARLPFIVELARQGGPGGPLLADLDLAQARRHLDVYQANALALRRYRPGPYPGRVTLFKAAEMRRPREETLGWGTLAGEGVEMHEVPGRHEALVVQPAVRTLGRLLRDSLERALAADRLRAAG